MNRLRNYKVAFLDAGGALIQKVSIPAESLTIAAQRAGEMATEIDAANYFITALPLFQSGPAT